jgi:YD repeat-containing protein
MKTKMWIRIISTILSILFVLEILPISVMAEEYNEYKDLSNAELSTQQEEKSPIVSEVVSERDAYKKVFEREDGSFTAIISSGPVHYFEDGEWLEIDNTLTETNGTITNESNGFSVDLPSEITSDKNVTIATEKAELSFTMENISSSVAEIAEIEPVNDETSLMMGLDNIASSVEYTSVMTNTNLVYDIGADSVKESIILSSCPSQVTDYSYTINTNGATLYLNEDNSINVVKNGQIEFVIEAPYMFDSNGISTDYIDVSLENIGESTYTLTYSPDYDWLSSDERVYPVTIDPTTTVYSATAISEAFIGTVDSTATDFDKFHYLKNANRLYFKYSDSVSNGFGKNAVITNAEFSLYCEALTDDDTLAVFPISSEWTEETVTPVTETADLLDYNIIKYGESAKRYVWDITEIAAKWQMNQFDNNGISIRQLSDTINTKIYRSSTANYTTRRPWFQIDYVTIDNMAEYDTETVDMGRAGTLYLNKYTGTYYVKRTDLSLNGNVSPVEMSFTYDPWSSSITRGSSYGTYWITDYYNKIFYSQTVTENNVTRHQYTFRDNGGIKTRFVEVVSSDEDYNTIPEGFTESYSTNYTRYKAVSGDLNKCLWVPKSDTTYKDFANMIIEDSTYRYTIDSINRITSRVHKTSGAVIAIEHRTASSDAIRSVTDGVGRKYDIPTAKDTNNKTIADKLVLYNSSGNMIKVSTLTGDVAIGVDYGYTAIDDETSHLTTVAYADGESITYEYNADGLMTAITNVDGSRLELRYSGDRVVGYTKYAYYVSADNSQNCFESQLDISFDGPKQRTFTYYEYDETTPSIVTKQRYDSTLQPTDYINSDGEYSYTKTTTTDTAEITSYSSNDDEATNLIANGNFESGKTGWISVPDNASIGSPVLSEPFAFDGVSGKMISLNSGLRKNLRVGQTIASLPANEDTVYTLSAWAQTLRSAATSYVNEHAHLDKTFAICVTDSEGNILAQYDFDTTTDEWQFGAVSFETDVALENIKVILMADCQIYYTRFDDVRLFESECGYVFSDEVTFNTMSSTDSLIINEDGTVYRTEPCEYCSCAQCTDGKTITSNDIETEVYYNCDCDKVSVECDCLGCRQERGSTTQSNELYDLPLSQTLSNGTKTLTTAYTYSSNSNYLASASDSGAVSYYNYNPDTGNLDEYGTQTTSNGEIINPVVYSYNAVGALTQVKQLVTDLSDGEGTLSHETNYTYADDRITSVSHNGTTYSFEYDHYGNLVNTSVNGNTIVSHSYPDHKNVGTVTFANGLVIGYTYDADGNITSIKHNGVEKYAYEYTDSTLSKSVDYINSLVTYYTDETTTVKFFNIENGAIIDGETIYCYNTDELTETVIGRPDNKFLPRTSIVLS